MASNTTFYGSLTLPVKTSDPATGTIGESYYNSAQGKFKVHDGTNWAGTKISRYNPLALDFFNDGSGVALFQLNGNGNDDSGLYNATVYGSPTWSTGVNSKTGLCMDLGSSNTTSTARRAEFSGLGFKRNMTFSFWVYYYGSVANDHGFFGGNSSAPGALFCHWNNGANTYYVIQSGGTAASGNTITNMQAWNHICVSYGASGGYMNVYTNGLLTSSAPVNSTSINDSWNGVNIAIGRDQCCTDDLRYMNGAFDTVRFFNRAVTAEEAMALYQEVL